MSCVCGCGRIRNGELSYGALRQYVSLHEQAADAKLPRIRCHPDQVPHVGDMVRCADAMINWWPLPDGTHRKHYAPTDCTATANAVWILN
jgi:hypothetical protein